MLTDEGLKVAYAAKKLLFPTAGVFFLASCPPGVAVVPWVAAIIKLNPTTLLGSQRSRLIEGSVKKYKKMCHSTYCTTPHVYKSLS